MNQTCVPAGPDVRSVDHFEITLMDAADHKHRYETKHQKQDIIIARRLAEKLLYSLKPSIKPAWVACWSSCCCFPLIMQPLASQTWISSERGFRWNYLKSKNRTNFIVRN